MKEKSICSDREFYLFTGGLMFGAAAGMLNGMALLAVDVLVALGCMRAIATLLFDYEIVRKVRK